MIRRNLHSRSPPSPPHHPLAELTCSVLRVVSDTRRNEVERISRLVGARESPAVSETLRGLLDPPPPGGTTPFHRRLCQWWLPGHSHASTTNCMSDQSISLPLPPIVARPAH